MKKIIKFIMLVMVMFVGVFSLASCGENYSKYVECEDRELRERAVLICWVEEKDGAQIFHNSQVRIEKEYIKKVVAVEFVNKDTGEKEIIELEKTNFISCNNPNNVPLEYYQLKKEYSDKINIKETKIYFIDVDGNKMFIKWPTRLFNKLGKEPGKCQ